MTLLKLIAVHILALISLCLITVQSFNCNEGPPGRYCTDDLSGYHICEVVVTNGTAQLKDTLVNCTDCKRCSCHVGPKCPTDIDPCSNYVQPPIFGYSFTLRYHGIIKDVAPPGTFVRNIQGLWYHHYSGTQSRLSFTDWENSRSRRLLIVPNGNGNWTQYNANELKCTNKSLTEFPVYKIPWDYNADGDEEILGFQTKRWKRIIGGRTTGSPVKTQYMYTRFDEDHGLMRLVRIYNIESGLRHTRRVNKTVGLFFPELSPFSMDLFRKPPNC